MKKRINLILLLTCLPISLFSQMGISGYWGSGQYALKQERDFQKAFVNSLKSEYDLGIKVSDDFPAYWNYALEYYITTPNKIRFTLGYMYQSSGSRAWYQDYSGFIKYDIVSEAHGPYFSLSKRIVNRFLFTDLRLKNQVLFGKSTYDYELQLSNNPTYQYSSYNKGVNFGLEPAVVLGKQMAGIEFLVLSGYYFDVIQTDFKDEISRWDGWRVSLGLGYAF